MKFSSPLDAKQFLINKITAQAGRTGVQLSDVDRRLLLLNLAEPQSANGIPLAALEDTNREFEIRMVQLLQSAYQRDKEYPSEQEKYQQALVSLKGSTHYILIMASAAIPAQPKAKEVGIYVILILAVMGLFVAMWWWLQGK